MSEVELDLQLADTVDAPVDEERARVRAEYRQRLAKKLKDPVFRNVEGFPIGTDEAILALSDPPYYTACPNPFIGEWLQEHGKPYDAETDDYHREPFAADVTQDKNDSVYNAHSYHTKVPYKAIIRYILHYTDPNDIVFDGFCGTGMTGVAAQFCADKTIIESLGYRVLQDGTILDEAGKEFSHIGIRKGVLNDLSPAASFITYNYNSNVECAKFESEAKSMISEAEKVFGCLYSTLHNATDSEVSSLSATIRSFQTLNKLHEFSIQKSNLGRINYTVWSDVFVCPNCGGELVFWDAAIDHTNGVMLDYLHCKHCNAKAKRRDCDRAFTQIYDNYLQSTVKQGKQIPVLINYSIGSKRIEKVPDQFDLDLIDLINLLANSYNVPARRMPEGKESRRNDPAGITYSHHFMTNRALLVFSAVWAKANTPLFKCALLGGFTVGLRLARFLVPQYYNKSTGPMKPWSPGTLIYQLLAESKIGSISWNHAYRRSFAK